MYLRIEFTIVLGSTITLSTSIVKWCKVIHTSKRLLVISIFWVRPHCKKHPVVFTEKNILPLICILKNVYFTEKVCLCFPNMNLFFRKNSENKTDIFLYNKREFPLDSFSLKTRYFLQRIKNMCVGFKSC